MEGRVHISEEIPDMADDNTHDFVPGNCTVHDETEAHQDIRQIRRGKDEEPQKAQPSLRVAARPDIYESRRERMAKERHGDERR